MRVMKTTLEITRLEVVLPQEIKNHGRARGLESWVEVGGMVLFYSDGECFGRNLAGFGNQMRLLVYVV